MKDQPISHRISLSLLSAIVRWTSIGKSRGVADRLERDGEMFSRGPHRARVFTHGSVCQGTMNDQRLPLMLHFAELDAWFGEMNNDE